MIVLKLDKVMKERGVKLKDLAVKIGLTDANLSNIKTGKISSWKCKIENLSVENAVFLHRYLPKIKIYLLYLYLDS